MFIGGSVDLLKQQCLDELQSRATAAEDDDHLIGASEDDILLQLCIEDCGSHGHCYNG